MWVRGGGLQGTHVVSISPDVGRNRLVIELVGLVGLEHLAAAEPQLREAVKRLAVPFDVLSDVRRLEGFEATALTHLQRLGELLQKHHVRRAVRVVGKSASGAVHMERVARQLGRDARLAFSLEEADAVLSLR